MRSCVWVDDVQDAHRQQAALPSVGHLDDDDVVAGGDCAQRQCPVPRGKGHAVVHAYRADDDRPPPRCKAMAQLAATKASSAYVKMLGARIQAAQQPEIDLMSSWLSMWGATVPSVCPWMPWVERTRCREP